MEPLRVFCRRYTVSNGCISSLQKIVFPEKVEKTVPRENAKISKKKTEAKKKFFFFFFEIGLVLETTCSSSEKFFFFVLTSEKKNYLPTFFGRFRSQIPAFSRDFCVFLDFGGRYRQFQRDNSRDKSCVWHK